MCAQLLFVHALSPLHAGTGQSVGAVDLAIARDRATGFPYLPGSSLKGTLRDRARQARAENLHAVFGPDQQNAADHAGALLVGDANLLLLPVRSIRGTFAYATSPYLLHRFARDLREIGTAQIPDVPNVAAMDQCLVAKGSSLVGQNRVVFEDLDFNSAVSDQVAAWARLIAGRVFGGDNWAAWARGLEARLCVVHDDVMAFLSEHATDVVARIALDPDRKTVKNGQLWYEESLPAETILVSVVGVLATPQATAADAIALVGRCSAEPMQLGGKATVGRGRCRLIMGGA